LVNRILSKPAAAYHQPSTTSGSPPGPPRLDIKQSRLPSGHQRGPRFL